VTDHHEVPYEETGGEKKYVIPQADAVVDPKRQDCEYPFKELCGAAVAYKLIEAMFEVQGEDVEDVDYLMENVAIATVGDVMDLVGENRIFVKQGLEMLKRTRNLGLKSLIECTNVNVDEITAYHIGFIIGPCLNASGRLDTAKRALELLCAKEKKDADILAGDLKALNDSRKELTLQAVEQAISIVEHTELGQDRVLVIYLPDCHESLAGIVAGRIRERYYKPTIVVTKTEKGLKGSGRSIDAYHMYEELNKCKELLSKFGGHKLAAGISLEESDLERLRNRLNEICTLSEDDLISKISIDLQMPLAYVTEELIEQLSLLEPFGKANTKPVFVEKDLEILNTRIMGKNQNVLKMQVRDLSGTVMDALYFGDVGQFLEYFKEKGDTKAAFTYYPGVNEYQGRRKLQIVVQNYR